MSVHPGGYGCTLKSRIPASGCGPRTIPELCDHPISCTTALRSSYNHQSLAPGQKGAEEPHLVNNDKHSSATGTLAVVKTSAGKTGDQEIRQTTHIEHHTWHNTDAHVTHLIDITCATCRSHHQACHHGMMTERADHAVARPP